MPAAQPSKSSVSNVIGAIIAAGLQPGAVRVNADGSFCVDLAGNANQTPSGGRIKDNGLCAAVSVEAPSWEDGK